MSDAKAHPGTDPDFQRVLSQLDGSQPGPLFIGVGGLHGNEGSGVRALRRVAEQLAPLRDQLRGRFVAFSGNIPALERGERYLDVDLNRIWAEEEAVRRGGDGEHRGRSVAGTSEAAQRKELQQGIDEQLVGDWTHVVLVDLHSTSAGGAPFCIMGDTLQNRSVASQLPIPIILGLEETVPGTLVEYVCEQGHVALCVEGGRHEADSTVDHHESSLWILLVAAGLLKASAVPDYSRHQALLRACVDGAPSVLEILHRHSLTAGESFRMMPGKKNFDRVESGDLLATHGDEPPEDVHAPFGGLLLMPLYQAKGDEGFFIVRGVRPVWLAFSALLRRLHVDVLLPLLPGVARDRERAGWLRVNRKVARFLAREFFHLFGYRHCASESEVLLFSRRREGPR